MATDFDVSYAQLRAPKRRWGVSYPPGSEDRVVQRLQSLGLSVMSYDVDPDDYRNYFVKARYKEDFPNYYPFALVEKSLEHYLAAQLLQLTPKDVYIDIASQHSPAPEIYHRLFGTRTYRQDLDYPEGFNGDKIGGDAANMPVPAEFVSKMALHCSFEHFEGDSDIRFLREVERVLKPGGAVCIVPFYLAEEYAIQTDPVIAIAQDVTFEDEAILHCAQGWGNRHGRFYDPLHVVTRLARNLGSLTMTIYQVTNAPSVDQSCYVRFALLITKSSDAVGWQGRDSSLAEAGQNQHKSEGGRDGNSLRDDLSSAQHLITSQQRQIEIYAAQIRTYQRLLKMIQSTRAYKIARRLGRWKWFDQARLKQD